MEEINNKMDKTNNKTAPEQDKVKFDNIKEWSNWELALIVAGMLLGMVVTWLVVIAVF